MSDEIAYALLNQAQQGDSQALNQLAGHVNGRIRRFIWHLVGQVDAEDDIVQDVLLALYRNLDRLEPAARLMPFLFRVTRSRCYDLLRRQGRYRVTSLDALPGQVPANRQPPPEEAADWLLLYSRLRAAMAQLPEPQRQVLILYAEEAFSYAQIADALNCSIGTVKSRLHQAKKNLKLLLGIPAGMSLDEYRDK